jgi:hypothetical protein
MQSTAVAERRGRGPTMDHDTDTPAYRIIYGVFGSIAAFSKETGIPLGSAHRFLGTGLIPARRQRVVIDAAKREGRELDPALFVPTS